MSLADDIVSDAILLIERPDLQQLAQRMFVRVLLEWHGAADFFRDITSASYEVAEGEFTVSGDLPLKFRKLVTIEGMANGFPVIEHAEFRETKGQVLRDYYGFRHPNTWNTIGNNFAAKFCRPVDSIVIGYLTFPQCDLVTDEESGTVSIVTNSWIVQEYSKGLMFGILALMALGTDKSPEASSWAALAAQDKQTLIANYAGD